MLRRRPIITLRHACTTRLPSQVSTGHRRAIIRRNLSMYGIGTIKETTTKGEVALSVGLLANAAGYSDGWNRGNQYPTRAKMTLWFGHGRHLSMVSSENLLTR